MPERIRGGLEQWTGLYITPASRSFIYKAATGTSIETAFKSLQKTKKEVCVTPSYRRKPNVCIKML